MVNNPLTEQDFDALYTWILRSRKEEWQVQNPGLCTLEKVQSAKRLLKIVQMNRRRDIIKCLKDTQCNMGVYRRLRNLLDSSYNEIDACFQIPDSVEAGQERAKRVTIPDGDDET